MRTAEELIRDVHEAVYFHMKPGLPDSGKELGRLRDSAWRG